MSLRRRALTVVDYIASCAFAFGEKKPSYFYGEWLWIDKKCWNSLYLRYESSTANVIRSNVHSGDTFWDVGANVGLFSLFAAKIVGAKGDVVAFEPSPEAFNLLRDNTKGISTVRPLPYGIGSQNGTVEMAVQGASSGSSFVKEVTELSQQYHKGIPIRSVPVRVYKMDAIAQEAPRPNVIKIDIEGFEVEALKGGEQLLADARPILIIEIHPLQIGLCGSHEDEVFHLLRRHDYEHEVYNRDKQWALYSIIAKPRMRQSKPIKVP
jgi:FkbM family methyltransferase